MFPLSLLLACLVAATTAATVDNTVTVPKDLMRFILGCQRVDYSREPAVPVYAVDIDEKSGTTSQKFGMLNMDELSHTLRQTVDSEVVLGQIMEQVEEAVAASSKGRGDCNVENKIKIEIPPQQVSQFNDKMQQVTQQNNFLLLEQINNLFTYKLRQQSDALDKIMRRKLKQINDKMDLILQALGKEVETDDTTGDDSDDLTGSSTEAPVVDAQTDQSVQPEPEPESDCKCKNKTQTEDDSSVETQADVEMTTHAAETDPASSEETTSSEVQQEPEPNTTTETEPQLDSSEQTESLQDSGEQRPTEKDSSETTNPPPDTEEQTEPPPDTNDKTESLPESSDQTESPPGSQEEQLPESEPEPTTTAAPSPPSAEILAKPLPIAVTTLKPRPDESSSKENSRENSKEDSKENSSTEEDNGSSSSEIPAFERVAQKPAEFYSNMGLVRPMMRPLRRNPQPYPIYNRERVRLPALSVQY